MPAQADFRPSLAHLWSHIRTSADNRYVRQAQVRTIRGPYTLETVAVGAAQLTSQDIVFSPPLSAAPTVHVVRVAQTPPAECPGSVEAPEAAPGHYCLYEGFQLNTGQLNVFDPMTETIALSQYGGAIVVASAASGAFASYGSWAVTRP